MVATDPYLHPGTGVLINHLGITSPSKLSHAENALASVRAFQIVHTTLPATFDLSYLCWLHKQLFGDLYAWAGEIRTLDDPRRPEAMPHHQIPEIAASVFRTLDHGPLLSKHRISDAAFLDASAELLRALNLLRPFRSGNGRTQRIFLNMVAAYSGRNFDWSKVSMQAHHEALQRATAHGAYPLRRMLKRCMTPSAHTPLLTLIDRIRATLSRDSLTTTAAIA